MTQVLAALRAGMQELSTAGVEDAGLEAEFLLAAALNVPRLNLALLHDRTVASPALACYKQGIADRCRRKPLAYILGEQPFLDFTVKVNGSVLIPRPETELLVERAWTLLDGMHNAVAVDVGTGSGNIAIALARHSRTAEVWGIDISPAALEIAQENLKNNSTQAPVRWIEGDLLSPLLQSKRSVDLIVANLPYVRTDEIAQLSPEVQSEPRKALDGGPEGLDAIVRLISQADAVLKTQGFLLLEIGADQGEKVLARLRQSAVWENPILHTDLAHLPRIVEAQKKAA